MIFLGFESSCDETGVALVRTGEGRNTEKNWGPSTLPQFMGDSLGDVASWILGQFSK
jgi:hypothetical protein